MMITTEDHPGEGATLVLSGETGHLALAVQSREPAARTAPYWDGNWVSTVVEVRTEHFLARFAASLRTDEFAEFLIEVERFHRREAGTARFRSSEDWLALDLERTSEGSLLVRGIAKDPADPDNRLHFAVRGVDDGDLAAALETILEQFPVLGRRDA